MRALKDYVPEDDDGLEFKAGDIIGVIRQKEEESRWKET